MKKSITGGSILAKGADTCVFKGRLMCTDPAMEALANEYESKGIPLVSRVVPIQGDASREISVEQLLIKRMETMRKAGRLNEAAFVSSRVIVSLVQCKGIYSPEDVSPPAKAKECFPEGSFDPGQFVALQTPEFKMDLFKYLDSRPDGPHLDHIVADIFLVLSQINHESQPTVFIHSDLHPGNALVTFQNHGGIADFGRSSFVPGHTEGLQKPSDLQINLNIPIGPSQFENATTWSNRQAQWIPEATVAYQLLSSWPSPVKEKSSTRTRIIDKLQDSYAKQNAKEFMRLCIYVFRFWDLFGLTRFLMYTANVKSHLLNEMQKIYVTEFQQGTLTTSRMIGFLQKQSRDPISQEKYIAHPNRKTPMDFMHEYNAKVKAIVAKDETMFQDFLKNPEAEYVHQIDNPESVKLNQDMTNAQSQQVNQMSSVQGPDMTQNDLSKEKSRKTYSFVASPTRRNAIADLANLDLTGFLDDLNVEQEKPQQTF